MSGCLSLSISLSLSLSLSLINSEVPLSSNAYVMNQSRNTQLQCCWRWLSYIRSICRSASLVLRDRDVSTTCRTMSQLCVFISDISMSVSYGNMACALRKTSVPFTSVYCPSEKNQRRVFSALSYFVVHACFFSLSVECVAFSRYLLFLVVMLPILHASRCLPQPPIIGTRLSGDIKSFSLCIGVLCVAIVHD